MEKINTTPDFEAIFLEDIKVFFKSGKYCYIKLAKAVKLISGLSFKRLLTAKPEELAAFKAAAKLNPNASKSEIEAAKNLLNDAYENFRSRKISKNLIECTGLKACPYCNRNFIHNFKRKNSKQATAQLDHFYPKMNYPFFALSLYNLIPCCSACNQRKSDKEMDIYHPYLESFNTAARFEYQGIAAQKDGQNYGFFDEPRIKLDLQAVDSANEAKVKIHKDVFNLEGLYENHKDVVKELIQKAQIYPESYLDQLEQQYVGSVFNSRDELLRLVTGGYVTDDEINLRPLSKFIKDISEQLGIR